MISPRFTVILVSFSSRSLAQPTTPTSVSTRSTSSISYPTDAPTIFDCMVRHHLVSAGHFSRFGAGCKLGRLTLTTLSPRQGSVRCETKVAYGEYSDANCQFELECGCVVYNLAGSANCLKEGCPDNWQGECTMLEQKRQCRGLCGVMGFYSQCLRCRCTCCETPVLLRIATIGTHHPSYNSALFSSTTASEYAIIAVTEQFSQPSITSSIPGSRGSPILDNLQQKAVSGRLDSLDSITEYTQPFQSTRSNLVIVLNAQSQDFSNSSTSSDVIIGQTYAAVACIKHSTGFVRPISPPQARSIGFTDLRSCLHTVPVAARRKSPDSKRLPIAGWRSGDPSSIVSASGRRIYAGYISTRRLRFW